MTPATPAAWLSYPWLSYHLFYHGDRDLALTRFVRPVVASLFEKQQIRTFFFIRYGLGGPHVRLRLGCEPGCERDVATMVTDRAESFLARWPSRESLDPEVIRKDNRPLLEGDPNEHEDVVYPDNALLAFDFEPEVERYGGPALIDHSLELFACSSILALRFLSTHGDKPWSKRLPAVLLLLARQAFHLATDEKDFLGLLGYAISYWGAPLATIVARGDKVFEQRRAVFRKLLGQQLRALAADTPFPAEDPTADPVYGRAALRLASRLRTTEPKVRELVATSQMHMTANRLGLWNPDEVYLGRLLTRAAEEVENTEPELWQRLVEAFDRRRERAEPTRARDRPAEPLRTILSDPSW